MENPYAELEYQRRHLIKQTTPEGRTMVMTGINRILDSMLDTSPVRPIPSQLPNSTEGQAHLTRGSE